eukprot:scaffold16570_cov83-Attheya_sp.AAC.1
MAHSGLRTPPSSSGQYQTIGYAAYDLPDPPIRNTDAGIAVSVFLSNAEMALREQASGTSKPMVCWGCLGHHRFAECPNKNDPAVKERAMGKVQEWRDQYVNKGYRGGRSFSSNELTEDFKKLGFPNKNTAEAIAKLVSPNTSAGERKDLLQRLSKPASNTSMLAIEDANKKRKDYDDDEWN